MEKYYYEIQGHLEKMTIKKKQFCHTNLVQGMIHTYLAQELFSDTIFVPGNLHIYRLKLKKRKEIAVTWS